MKKCKVCSKELLPHKRKFCSDPCQRMYGMDNYLASSRNKMDALNTELERFVENLYRAASIYNEFVILQETVPTKKKWKADVSLFDKDIKYVKSLSK